MGLPLLVAAGLLLSQPAVVDGDTLRDRAGERYRVENIDAPERGDRPSVEKSGFWPEASRAFVEAWIAQAGDVEAIPTGRRDRYGRVAARIEIDGVDLGGRLIARGLAQRWRGRKADFCTGVWLTPVAR